MSEIEPAIVKHTYKRERNKRHSIQQPQAKDNEQNNSQNHLPLNTPMDSFFTLFTLSSEPETAPETSTPVDADGGSGTSCTIA